MAGYYKKPYLNKNRLPSVFSTANPGICRGVEAIIHADQIYSPNSTAVEGLHLDPA